MKKFTLKVAMLGATAMIAAPASADQVITDDLIVQGSACIGLDCVNGEAFGFDTLRLKENNVRIHAEDTSSSGTFPFVDWRLTFNDNANGGLNKFSIDDIDNARSPFTIEAAAPNNSLYVKDSGRIGIKTSSPVVDLHIVEGNSPTLRLEQDGSDGFSPQTWDLAGNEVSFFIRDVTNGSKLPFRIQSNTPEDTLFMSNLGRIGIGTNAPEVPLHIRSNTGTFAAMLELENNGAIGMIMDNNGANAVEWRYGMTPSNTDFVIVTPDSPGPEFQLSTGGNLSILGTLSVNGGSVTVPDYVFADDYNLRPLSEVRTFIEANSHLPEVPSETEIAKSGLNMTDMQMTLLKKIEELTLYTLAQEETIARLQEDVATLKN